jgi:hypothetical protein
MADDKENLPVKVEFGAKASIEIKGEIPKESLGGLVNALTDAIRPWTEACGLKADQIRLHPNQCLSGSFSSADEIIAQYLKNRPNPPAIRNAG